MKSNTIITIELCYVQIFNDDLLRKAIPKSSYIDYQLNWVFYHSQSLLSSSEYRRKTGGRLNANR